MSADRGGGPFSADVIARASSALLRRLNEASSASELVTRAMDCENFLQDMGDKSRITALELERLHAMFDAAVEIKIREFMPSLPGMPMGRW